MGKWGKECPSHFVTQTSRKMDYHSPDTDLNILTFGCGGATFMRRTGFVHVTWFGRPSPSFLSRSTIITSDEEVTWLTLEVTLGVGD